MWLIVTGTSNSRYFCFAIYSFAVQECPNVTLWNIHTSNDNGSLAFYEDFIFFPLSPTILLSDLTICIWVTWRGSYKKQELLTLHEHLGSPPVFGWVRGAHLFSFLCCVFGVLFVFVLCLVSSQICRCLWIVYSWLSLCFSLTFIDHVPTIIYHMRPMLDILLNNELIFNTDRYNGSYLFCI